MERALFKQLENWQKRQEHLPLLMRGARQVGKTFLVEQFGKRCFENTVSINFELSPEYSACFATQKPKEILNKIEILGKQIITPGRTLLFLDEIQACPNAIMAMRYFKEEMPQLHLIGAGSLLEFALSQADFKMPVGRVQYLYLRPLSFMEYLEVTNNQKLLEFINQIELGQEIPEVIHQAALKLIREYMVLSGLPMEKNQFLITDSLAICQEYQTLLLRTYSDDFAKYSSTNKSQHQSSEECNRHEIFLTNWQRKM